MRIAEFLRSAERRLVVCAPGDAIDAVAARLSAHNVGALPVCEADGALVGVLSERDLVRAFASDPGRLQTKRARDLMTREVIACDVGALMGEAEKLMHRHRIRHLPILSAGALHAMLSIRDVMVWRLFESREEVNVLRDAVISARHA